MEYDDPERGREVAERAREFVEAEAIPVERELLGNGPVDGATVADLRERAREYDVYGPQIPEEYGGLGLDFRAMLPVFEEAGRSLLGAVAMRCAAPDEGNMHTLEMVATEEQKERWLRPLAEGEIRSGFSMTEPMQGSGSDPKMIRTTAEKDGDEWVINGHKWWTTQGSEADLLIVMARTDEDAHPYAGSSMFLVPSDTEGVDIVRDVAHLGGEVTGASHAEIRYRDVRVPEENLLGAENAGFEIAQRRLGPARLTHCMRFLGMADRALDIATAYASEREAFGEPLSEKQALRFEVADHRTRLHAARTMVRHAAGRIRDGREARIPVAMCKTFAANAAQEAVDAAVQCCGGNGIGKDLPLADFYENVRQFRVIDGADEVHRRTIARDAFEDPPTGELEAVTRYDG
ncbi:acyl-CoA dehydrogenase [Halostella sp. JP-L12]|uniref:acyl-CoA dehydrogenase family protein n=1 Tax=Halostella TaxID=1843185 RepID=UPI000EF75A77|nr:MULTISPECIES: acyl-CoA dehydrogenase family protein [Halostella]NHN47024.1 acyl-CoA dehydrogenase [Halostella sp. JP-L12]